MSSCVGAISLRHFVSPCEDKASAKEVTSEGLSALRPESGLKQPWPFSLGDEWVACDCPWQEGAASCWLPREVGRG